MLFGSPQNLTFLTEYRIVIVGALVFNSVSYTSCICPCSPSWNEVCVLWLHLPRKLSHAFSQVVLFPPPLTPSAQATTHFYYDMLVFLFQNLVYISHMLCNSFVCGFFYSACFLDSPMLLCHIHSFPFISIFHENMPVYPSCWLASGLFPNLFEDMYFYFSWVNK